MKGNPLISIIIPVYNPGIHLFKCLDSMVNQTYKNLEIILIDDGSTDGSDKICDEYASRDSRIKCVHQSNSGVSKARNRGLELMTGEYVHFPDSDDYYELDSYEYLLSQLSEYKTEAVCFEHYITYHDSEIKHIASDNVYGYCDTKNSIKELLFSDRSFLCTKLLPSYATKNVRFIDDIYRDEDTIFCMMALHNVSSSVHVERPLLHYVQSEQSATRGAFRTSQLSAVKAIPLMEDFLTANYPDMLNRWYASYMNLMITLYGDMYLDDRDYSREMSDIYNMFLYLYRKMEKSTVLNLKSKMKIEIFRCSPSYFCRVHKLIHNL